MIQKIRGKIRFFVFLAAVLGIAYVGFQFLFMDFVVDMWWFESLGYLTYFFQKATYKYLILASSTLVFFVIFFLNFWIASKLLTKPSEGITDSGKAINRLIYNFRYVSLRIYTPLAFLLAIILAYPLYERWEEALLFFFSPDSGIKDPHFSKDISFYLFSLPIYRLIEKRLVISFLILTAATFILYLLEIRFIRRTMNVISFPRPIRIHLSLLLFGLVLLAIWHLMLMRYELVYVDTHKIFYGPGFVEMNVKLPLIWLTALSLVGTGLTLVVFFNQGKKWKPFVLFLVLSITFYGLLHTNFISDKVEKYIVRPNELSKELKYISRSIKSTLQAYNLENATVKEYIPAKSNILERAEELKDLIRNIPVWDHELLLDVYKQLQGLRPYYDFLGVDVDRYNIKGQYQQVFVSARELSVDKLPENAKNWVNLHMKYTHGHGVVMTPAIQGGEEPITWFLKDLPVHSHYDITLKQPAIYYGQANYTYAIVPNKLGEVGYPQGEDTYSENYEGKGGIPLSILRKAIFSIYLKEKNIFFTTNTTRNSKLLFRRNITEMIKRITPFLVLDKDPYVVVTKEKIYWIQDAYTVSDRYPGAEPFDNKFNYIRNSVKIVIDAYDGLINYYISDPADPIIGAYRRAYPWLFKPISAMDEELKAHIRYPKDIFEIQMAIFAKYHQVNPENFYKQEDTWLFARVFREGKEKTISPYYLTLNIFNPKTPEFFLIQPFSPKGLDILRAIATVGCDGENYGKITVLTFPKETQVYGPSQVEAMIDQDTYISQQFTLWNQIGSSVERGNITILPYGGSVIYIQPVYLKATGGLKIPELKRLIVSYEDIVVMDVSLEAAIDKLIENLEQREKMYRERLKKFSGEE